MHWRKPFPPRSVRPSPFAELYNLLVTSLRQEEAKTSEVANPNTATFEPMPVPHSAD